MYLSTALVVFLFIVLYMVVYYISKQKHDENNNVECKNPSLSLHEQEHVERKDPSSLDKHCRRFSLDDINLATHELDDAFGEVYENKKQHEERNDECKNPSLDQQSLLEEERVERKDSSSSSSKHKQCRRFSLDEIILATHDFDDALVIGKGGFGKVYIGKIDVGEEIEVAIKRSNLDSCQGATEFWAEIETLSKFRHSHIVSLLGYCEEKPEMILVYEYMANGSLDDHLHKKRANRSISSVLSWVQRLHICIGAARGLDYLHTGTGVHSRIIHRDVKSSNILLDENLVAKISDFGVSRTGPAYHSGATTNVYTGQIIGTFGYMDAEYFSTHRLTRKSDVYAFGVVLLEVLCGRPALDFTLDEQQHSLVGWAKQCIKEGKISRVIDPCLRGKVEGYCLKEFAQIAYECVHTTSKGRPTMTKVLSRLEVVLAWTLGSRKSSSKSILIKKAWSLFSTKGPRNRYDIGKKNNSARLEDVDELPSFNLNKIAKATNNFSIINKIGEGGFGPVYKGMMEDGQVVAVKRHSKTSAQNFNEFKNEVLCIQKLQHRNLVNLLGYCDHGNELILIYEYMANKSLDRILFDETRSSMLDWPKRFQIILGIARGVLYLHQDSRLQIIHRDLKASNILLDDDMDPKISDFGLSRIFVGSDFVAETNRVVGTYGYMCPDYALFGKFSVKTDVFSFGVLVLEIVSGERNRMSSHKNHSSKLLGHAWRIHKENRSIELMSESLRDSCVISEVLRSIHVGLLCVQDHTEDRPTMLEVVLMLLSDGVLPQPNQPTFYSYGEESLDDLESVSSGEE